MKVYKKAMKYFADHVAFNGITHVLAGIGIGMLLTYPVAGNHPVRWAVVFLILGVAGHVWAATQKP